MKRLEFLIFLDNMLDSVAAVGGLFLLSQSGLGRAGRKKDLAGCEKSCTFASLNLKMISN